jgi:arabinofuranosyltransferase
LVRPEFLLLSFVYFGVVLSTQWRSTPWKRNAALLAAGFALPVAYQLFRMGYYGSLVPNSAIAKEASRSYWSFGLTYLRQTVIDSYALWLPLLILLVGAYVPLALYLRRQRRRRPLLVVGAFFVGGLLLAVYIVRVGGDFMHARLLLPALFSLLAPVAVIPATKRFALALLVVPWAAVVIVALRFPGEKDPVLGTRNPNAILASEIVGPSFDAQFAPEGAYVLEHRLPGTPRLHHRAVAFYGVGAPGYALGPDTYVLDLLGLGDAFTSHLRLEQRAIVAHEKPLPAPWVVARLVNAGSAVKRSDVARPIFLIKPIDDADGEPFANRIVDARAALHCRRLRDFMDSYRSPLDARRFLENLGDAFDNFSFRIPPEPRDALRELCPQRS